MANLRQRPPTRKNPQADTAEAQQARRETAVANWKICNYSLYRHYQDYQLNEWPYLHRFYVYIRKDVLERGLGITRAARCN